MAKSTITVGAGGYVVCKKSYGGADVTIQGPGSQTISATGFSNPYLNVYIYPNAGYEYTGHYNPDMVSLGFDATYKFNQIINYSYSATCTGGTVSPSSGTVRKGTQVKFTVTPNANYVFDGWSDGNKSNPRTVTINSNLNLSASCHYKPLLTVNSQNTSQGTASCSTAGRVEPNTEHTLTATPKSNYRFIGWYSNAQLVSTDNPAKIRVGSVDVTYQARFASTQHTVNVSFASGSSGKGTAKLYVNGVEKPSGTVLTEGTVFEVVATPGDEYNFAQWSIGGVNQYTSTVPHEVNSADPATINCVASFSDRNPYEIGITKLNPSLGTVQLKQGDRTWDEQDGAITATGRSGLLYTAKAIVNSATSLTGKLLNKFTGWYRNNMLVSSQPEYQFSQGANIQTETLQALHFVARFDPKALYRAVLNIPVSAGGTCVIEPVPDVPSPDRWLEGTITAVATPNTGYYVGSFNVSDLDYGPNGHVIAPQKDNDGNFRDSFTLNYNARITVNFLKIPCTPHVRVHEKSMMAGAGLASVRSTAQGGSTDGMVYGDIAIFEATPNLGFQFGGWYLENGDPAPDATVIESGISHTYRYTDAEYRTALTGDLTLIARFKSQIILGIAATQNAHGTIRLDDASATSGTLNKWVLIGETVRIQAVPQTPNVDFFGSWFQYTDTAFTNPLELSADETFEVAGGVHYVARFISSADALFVALCDIDNDTGEGDATLGALRMMTAGSAPVEVERTDEATFLRRTGLSSAPDGAVAYYTLVGTSRVTLEASPTAGRGFVKWTKESIIGGAATGEADMGQVANVSIVVNRHFIYRAYWGDPKPVRIVTHFANGSNIVNGNLKLDGVTVVDDTIQDKTETEIETSATYTQGDVVKIAVDIKNGYLFAGWFYDPECENPVRDSVVDGVTYTHLDAEYVFAVSSPVTICAKFVEDADAIYKWEGSSERKMAEWESKQYIGAVPFDPSAVRVEALKYPVTVGVGMYSSPLAAPTKVKIVHVENERGRRLKIGRPERYVNVRVSSNGEVDSVVVATSMEGLIA